MEVDCNDLAGAVFHFLTQSLKFYETLGHSYHSALRAGAAAADRAGLPDCIWQLGRSWRQSHVQGNGANLRGLAILVMAGHSRRGQALLLLLPINIAERRLPARRKLKVPVIVCAFFLGSLCFAGILSVLCAVFKDDGLNVFAFVDKIFTKDGHMTDAGSTCSGIIITLTFWIIWAFIFHRFAKSDDPDALLKRGTRWLLRGSILELVVAVPSHVIARRRDDCCAPVGTFWGIATGISVMLLCFGPGVYFLFVERFQKLKPKFNGGDKYV